MRARESRLTEAAPEIPTKGSTDSLAESALTDEDREAAFQAGRQQGKAERFEAEIEDRARALLHTWATESRNMATHYAAKVGPHWLALISECGELDG